MTRGIDTFDERLGGKRSKPSLASAPLLAILLAIALAVAGCSYGRAGANRPVTATPPDPPPVPRAKPIANPAVNPGVNPAVNSVVNSGAYSLASPAASGLSNVPAVQPAAARPDLAPPAAGARAHVITEGQSLYAVAQIYDVSVADLIRSNGLAPPYKLAIGQQLVVPGPGGAAAPQAAAVAAEMANSMAAAARTAPAAPATHVVESGDTVYSIARRYRIDMAALVSLNAIPPSYVISPGQRLALPVRAETATAGTAATAMAGKLTGDASKLGASGAATGATTGATPRATTAGWTPPGAQPAPAVAMMPPPAVTGPIPEAPPRASDKFLWPVEGDLLLSFGPKEGGLHNDGINIAAPRGSPVLAAENGVVAYVGNQLRGFGNLLLIKHDGGWMTAYAHNEEILVGRGARVERGQTVARVGDSGNVVAPQLHFEIRRGIRAVDPTKLLSPRQSAQKM